MRRHKLGPRFKVFVALVATFALAGFSSLAVSAAPAASQVSSVAQSPVAAQQEGQCGNATAGLTPRLSVDRTTIGLSETATVTVTGTNYYLANHRCGTGIPGGVYVFFGWVEPGGRWGPSHRDSSSTRGHFGYTFSYPGEGGGAETREDDTGAIRFIAFTKAGDSGRATDYHMDANGNWQTTITIRGAAYGFVNTRTNTGSVVDCTQVQCGIFTFGGHGKPSATNELFVPINFVDPSGAPAAPGSGQANAGGNVVNPNPNQPIGQGGSTGTIDPNIVDDRGIDLFNEDDIDVNSDDADVQSGDDAGSASDTQGPVGSIGEGGGPVGQAHDDNTEVRTESTGEQTAAGSVDFGDQGGGAPWPIIIGAIVVLAALIGGGVAMVKRGSANAQSEV